MNDAIAKLMIATCFVDGSSPASERELILRIMDVLQIDEKTFTLNLVMSKG